MCETKSQQFSHCAVGAVCRNEILHLNTHYSKNSWNQYYYNTTWPCTYIYVGSWFDEIFFGKSKFFILPHCGHKAIQAIYHSGPVCLQNIEINKKNIAFTWKLFRENNAQCGNYGNLLSHIFGKNFVKVTF